MREITKADWKLFQARIGNWQEAYMERLNQKYIKLLQGEGYASDKFWELEKRIRKDKNTPGVRLRLEKQNVGWDLLALLQDEVIKPDDLEGFNEELKEDVLRLYQERSR